MKETEEHVDKQQRTDFQHPKTNQAQARFQKVAQQESQDERRDEGEPRGKVGPVQKVVPTQKEDEGKLPLLLLHGGPGFCHDYLWPLAAMAETFIANANAAGIPMEVLHRVAAMASGGMDTLPHNGAVITLLAVTGLTHRQAYKDIFAITCIKTMAVFVVIGLFYAFGVV